MKNGSIDLRVTPYTGTYDGRQHNAVTVNVTPSDAKIEYSINGGTYSTTMPTITNTSSFTFHNVSINSILLPTVQRE